MQFSNDWKYFNTFKMFTRNSPQWIKLSLFCHLSKWIRFRFLQIFFSVSKRPFQDTYSPIPWNNCAINVFAQRRIMCVTVADKKTSMTSPPGLVSSDDVDRVINVGFNFQLYEFQSILRLYTCVPLLIPTPPKMGVAVDKASFMELAGSTEYPRWWVRFCQNEIINSVINLHMHFPLPGDI